MSTGRVLVFRFPGHDDGFYIVRANGDGFDAVGGPFDSRSDATHAARDAGVDGLWYIGECTAGVLTVAQPPLAATRKVGD